MFSNLKTTILKLNANVSDLANQEKAKKLRSKLLTWGGVCLAIGMIGVFACFITFGILSFSAVATFSKNFTIILIPFFLIIPFGLLISVGAILLKLGLSILIAGATTKFVDKALNRRCECGHTLGKNEKFCPKCGKAAVKTCPKCNAELDIENEYCSNCGHKF